MKKLFPLILSLIPILALSQKEVPISLKIAQNGFLQSRTSFNITTVVDNREDTTSLGVVYDAFGVLTNYFFEGGLSTNIKKLIDDGYSRTKKGAREIVLVVNKMSLSEEENTSFGYRFHIELDYFLRTDSNLIFLLEDNIVLNEGDVGKKKAAKVYRKALKNSILKFQIKLDYDSLSENIVKKLTLKERLESIKRERAVLWAKNDSTIRFSL